MKQLLRLLAITLFLFFGIFIAIQQYNYQISHPIDALDTNKITILIEKGDGVEKISNTLIKNDLITSRWIFWWYLKWNNKYPQIKAGTHQLSKRMSLSEIVDKLTKNAGATESIVIPEGYSIAQIDDLLVQKKLINRGEFIECSKTCTFPKYEILEGYLFPDTYFVDLDRLTPESFIQRLLNHFENKTELMKKVADTGNKNWNEIIIMASLIEKETRTTKERPIVSGILWKRIQSNMFLGVDATIRYALDDWENTLTYSDLQTDSPYNTRKNLGLPPGPIANPGLESIEAALNPVKSPYYYYLHDKEGKIHYARTNDEHNENKRRYIK